MRKSLIAIAVAGCATILPAHAAALEWHVNSTNDDGVVTSIVAQSETETGVMLSCSGDKIIVGVSTVPGPVMDRLALRTKRIKSKQAETTIADKNAEKEPWYYLPRQQVAISKNGITGKRFFNAAVRGDLVTWQLSGSDASTIQLPAMNAPFKSFAKSCVVTNGG